MELELTNDVKIEFLKAMLQELEQGTTTKPEPQEKPTIVDNATIEVQYGRQDLKIVNVWQNGERLHMSCLPKWGTETLVKTIKFPDYAHQAIKMVKDLFGKNLTQPVRVKNFLEENLIDKTVTANVTERKHAKYNYAIGDFEKLVN